MQVGVIQSDSSDCSHKNFDLIDFAIQLLFRQFHFRLIIFVLHFKIQIVSNLNEIL